MVDENRIKEIVNEIKQSVGNYNDYAIDFHDKSTTEQEEYLMALVNFLQQFNIQFRDKYLSLSLDYGNDMIAMRIINAATISHIQRLIEILKGNMDNDVEDYSDSDQAIMMAFLSLHGFQLEWFTYTEKIKQGAYFPYFNSENSLDLSVFGIYHNELEAVYDDNCLITAIINSKKFTSHEIEHIRSMINTRYIPRDDLKIIAFEMNTRFDVYYYNDKRNKIDKAVRIGPKDANRIIRLLLRWGHYMIYMDEMVPKNKYNVHNLNTLITKLYDDNKFIQRNDIAKCELFNDYAPSFNTLEYADVSVKPYTVNHIHNDFQRIYYAIINNAIITIGKRKINVNNIPEIFTCKTLIYVPDCKKLRDYITIDCKYKYYRNTIQEIHFRNKGNILVIIRSAKTITSVDFTDKSFEEFSTYMNNYVAIINKHFNVNVHDFTTLPQMVLYAAYINNCFDGVYSLSGIPRMFANKCIHGGIVKNMRSGCFEINDNVTCIDINSSYGSAIINMKGIAKGKPIPFYGYEPIGCYYFAHIIISNLQCKHNNDYYSIVKNGDMYVDSIFVDMIREHYNCDIQFIKGYYFNEGYNDNIHKFVRNIYNLRTNPLLYKPAKNMLSSLYGKSLQSSQQYKIKTVNKNDLTDIIRTYGNYIEEITKNKNNKYTVKIMKSFNVSASLPQLGVAVLSQSKISLYDIIYRAIDNNIPVYSVHTDSIVLPSKNIKTLNVPIDTTLGHYKIEYTAKHIKFTSPKCYKAILTDNSIRMRGKVE